MEFVLSILQSIGFNWHVALVNFINFLLILLILNKFFFRKVFANLESRQELIKKGLENASEAEKTLANAIAEGEALMANSKKAAEEKYKVIIDRAEADASSISAVAAADADKLRADLNKKIANAEQVVLTDFNKVAPELVVKLLKKALGDIDEATHNKLVSSLVK